MMECTKKLCDSFLELGVPGFDLAVYQNGECLLRYIKGHSDLERKIPMNGSEKYNVYSCSKVITCVAAMQLYEKGLFSLEDKLSDYMPEFAEMTVKCEHGVKKAEKSILIKHLFEMTAGFSYDCDSPSLLQALTDTNGKCPTREAMRYLAKEPLLFEPGDRWEYSLCHDVLAALVEVLTNQKFEDYVQENIFSPLDMKNSTFMLPDSEIDTLAAQYRFKNGSPVNIGKQIVTHKLGSEYAAGGAGCISTVDDFIKFAEGLRTYKLLKPETLTLMTTDRLNDTQRATYWTRDTHGYGLGVWCPKTPADKATDFGWGGAAGAYLAINTKTGLSVYLGMHLLSSPAQGIRSTLYRFIKAELTAPDELDALYKELEDLYDYHLTY